MRNAYIVRAHPVDEEQDQLVEPQPEQKREAGYNEDMAHMKPVGTAPPLRGDGQAKYRNTDLCGPDHQNIAQRSEERHVGKGCVSTWRYGWERYPTKKKQKK